MHSDTKKLKQQILELLHQYPEGLSEHVLLKQLGGYDTEIQNRSIEDLHQLFRHHFLLFHILYRLQTELLQQQQCLQIGPLSIRLAPCAAAEQQALEQHDATRTFYADINRLETTEIEQIAQWLGRFWAKVPANERRKRALATLELEDPVTEETIKEQYRRLAMAHHPDRGGSNRKLQSINIAMAILSGKC